MLELLSLVSIILIHFNFLIGGKGGAQEKIEALRDAGVRVTLNPAKMGSDMFNIMTERDILPENLKVECKE